MEIAVIIVNMVIIRLNNLFFFYDTLLAKSREGVSMRINFMTAIVFIAFSCSVSVWGMGDEYHDHSTAAAVVETTIVASGTVKSIAQDHMSLRIFHDPIPVLKWPAMNMPFEVIDHDITHPLEIGDRVNFEFVQKEGKNIIVKISK